MRLPAVALILVVVLLPACGDKSNPAAPTAQTLQGAWRATKAQFVSKANSSRQVDIVAQGSTVAMVFSGSNYTWTQTESGKPQKVQTGTWSASSDMMTLSPSGVTWKIEFDMTFSGNNLTLNGGSVEFDFTNGVFEEATLNMTLVRQ